MVVLISGGSRGIGKAIAKAFAKERKDIVICYRDNRELAEKVVYELRSFGVKVRAYCCDVSDIEQCKNFICNVKKDFGQVDILVNNAGIVEDAPLVLMTENQFKQVIDVNIKGVFHLTKLCMPFIKESKAGRLINISSISGIVGIEGQSNYAASKAAVIGFTKTIAKEYGKYGVTCNAIAPGYIDTDMPKELSAERKKEIIDCTLLKRIGRPNDIAELVVFLASDKASFITGEVIKIDGGLSLN